jgi:hypothetical protein
MIRIDEIYQNVFWPWMNQHCQGARVWFCDPPGRSDPDSLFNYGRDDIQETSFVYFHDQEPIHLDLHHTLFDAVIDRNQDLLYPHGVIRKELKTQNCDHIVVSELGENLERLCDMYGWKSHYYFYHGWASLDWYRGYDRTFVVPRARYRAPTKTFMSPNRIVAGKRDHRVLFLYHVFKQRLDHNYISAPRTCPYENCDISNIACRYNNIYPDIEQVFVSADLPRLFQGEDTQVMSSYCLGNWGEAADSLVYVPTETVYFGRRTHLTEKTFKAIAMEMPFVLVAPAGSLEYLRSYGFQTFDHIFDESYDTETDDILRLERVATLLRDLESMTVKERQQLHHACLPVVEHNWNHFYGGGFEKVLWDELQRMLEKGFQGLKVDPKRCSR